MPVAIQPSFAKGVLASALHGRVDTAAYAVGLFSGENLLIKPFGGAYSRPGFRFVAPVKDHTYAPRLIEFSFNRNDVYSLELGDGYMRVLRNGAHVTNTPKTITGITQDAVAVVTATAHGFSDGDHVDIEGVEGMVEVNNRRFIVANKTTDTFELVDQITGDDVNSLAYAPYTGGGTAADVYEISTPYAQEDLLELNYVQSADVITLTHTLYPIMELRRTDHNAWTLTEPTFAPAIDAPTGMAVTVNTTGSVTRRYRVTAVRSGTLEESLPALNATAKTITGITQANPGVVTANAHGFLDGDEVELNSVAGMTEVNGQRYIVSNKTTNTFELESTNTTSYTAYTSGGTANQTFVRITNGATTSDDTITWTDDADAIKWTVYLEKNGLFGFIGETNTPTFTNGNIDPDVTISPPAARNPFLGANNYPATAAYYEQRRVFGGTLANPDSSIFSRIGQPYNFTVSDPLQEDDAITAKLSSRKVNAIRQYIPQKDLLVLTAASEWSINAGPDAAFSYVSLRQKPQSEWGAGTLRPITVGNVSLFASDNLALVRSLGYSLQIDGYSGSEVSLLASHYLRGRQIVDWTWASPPDGFVFSVLDDGKALAMTFHPEQEVVAWTRWRTQGWFERTTSTTNPATSPHDRLYAVVKRRVFGQVVRYIEYAQVADPDDPRDCFYVDSGLSHDEPIEITDIAIGAVTTITAPAHGLSNGDTVEFSDIVWEADVDAFGNETQPDQLNYERYEISNVTTDTFEVEGVDSLAFNEYVEGGNVRVPVSTIYGAYHLAGKSISVLADGNYVSGLTVSATGSVDLPEPSCRVHLGLSYVCDLETLNLEIHPGTLQGRAKRLQNITVRFERSRGMLIGPNKDNLVEAEVRDLEDMGEPTRLLTGDWTQQLMAEWNTNGRVFIRQIYPLPMNVIAVVPVYEVED